MKKDKKSERSLIFSDYTVNNTDLMDLVSLIDSTLREVNYFSIEKLKSIYEKKFVEQTFKK